MTALISAKQIHKSYGTRPVLAGAEFSVHSSERIGVVGRNGAGKSTFGRIVAGLEGPDSGTLTRARGAEVLYLDQIPRFEGDPTAEAAVAQGLTAWHEATSRHQDITRRLESAPVALEALLEEQQQIADAIEGLGGWQQEHRVQKMLGYLGVTAVERRVSTLSGGEQRRVALARILVARPQLAILDEPTNHLDAETSEWLEQHLLEEFPGAVLLITHDRYLLDRVASRTFEVADGLVHAYDGGYELYLEQKAERLAHAARTEQNRQNFLRRELEWLRRQPKARGTKQKARIQRAESAIGLKGPREEQTAKLELDVARTGKTILECQKLVVARGDNVLVSDLTLFLTEGERIGVVGRNGMGKTTFLKTLLGQLEPAAGTVNVGRNTKIAYFDQLRTGLDEEKSVFENVIGDQTRIAIGNTVLEPRAYLERFQFDRQQERQRVGALSGGERARVALARLLRQSANVLVLDEPTNDLDVATLGALESLLVDFGVTAIVVTHDRYFLDRVATAILAFEGEGRVTLYPGNYTTFRRLRAAAPDAAGTLGASEAAAPKKKAAAAKKSALTQPERRELSGLPDAIERAEARVAELGVQLGDPDAYASGGGEAQRLLAELEAARAELERLMLRWEELEEKAAAGSG